MIYVFYANEAVGQGKQEASLLGAISLITVLLLVVFAFRSLQPILFALLAISSGVIAAVAAVLLIYEQIYALTLVFGVAVIGITIDYCFHYCCAGFVPENQTAEARRLSVSKGMRWGMVSSVIGFFCLIWMPFPGLRQIGIFSIAGLLSAYFTVIHVIPIFDHMKTRKAKGWLYSLSVKLADFWEVGRSYRKISLLGGLLIIAAFVTLPQLKVNDDIRQLQSLPKGLKLQEEKIKSVVAMGVDAQFFILHGNREEDILQQEEKLTKALDPLIAAKKLAGYRAISTLLPSKARQEENLALVQQALRDVDWSKYPFHAAKAYDGEAGKALSWPDIEKTSLGEVYGLQHLPEQAGAKTGEHAHIVALQGVKDLTALAQLPQQAGLSSVVFVDPAGDISKSFETYRVQVLILLAISLLLTTIILGFRYGWMNGGRIILPVLLSLLLTPLILVLMGEVFTFFNAVGLILVFALGIDYAIFAAESGERHYLTSMYANCLSALSSMLAFGLLVFSDLYAIHAFGLTILAGVACAFILAPVARLTRRLAPAESN